MRSSWPIDWHMERTWWVLLLLPTVHPVISRSYPVHTPQSSIIGALWLSNLSSLSSLTKILHSIETHYPPSPVRSTHLAHSSLTNHYHTMFQFSYNPCQVTSLSHLPFSSFPFQSNYQFWHPGNKPHFIKFPLSLLRLYSCISSSTY